MKIEKAIENNEGLVRHGGWLNGKDNVGAIKLGIEALKRIQYAREHFSLVQTNLLPGETEDSSEAAQEINPEETID